MSLRCPASVCISVLRETLNPKTFILTDRKEKTRKRQQTTVVQIDQCIVFQKSSSARSGNQVQNSGFSFCFKPTCFAGENFSAVPLKTRPGPPHLNFSMTVFPPSDCKHSSLFLSVQIKREAGPSKSSWTQRFPGTLIGWHWQTRTDQSSLQKPGQRNKLDWGCIHTIIFIINMNE